MDPWIAFDEARAQWDVERTQRARLRDLRWNAKQDLLSHVVGFLLTNTALWVLWAASGMGLIWPMLLTAPWTIGLVADVLRVRWLPIEPSPSTPAEPSAVSAAKRT